MKFKNVNCINKSFSVFFIILSLIFLEGCKNENSSQQSHPNQQENLDQNEDLSPQNLDHLTNDLLNQSLNHDLEELRKILINNPQMNKYLAYTSSFVAKYTINSASRQDYERISGIESVFVINNYYSYNPRLRNDLEFLNLRKSILVSDAMIFKINTLRDLKVDDSVIFNDDYLPLKEYATAKWLSLSTQKKEAFEKIFMQNYTFISQILNNQSDPSHWIDRAKEVKHTLRKLSNDNIWSNELKSFMERSEEIIFDGSLD